jgi:formylglycine-generating enzyme required for sulfatase activity
LEADPDLRGTDVAIYRLLRGGSWFTNPWFCRSASRLSLLPDDRYTDNGFRVCCLPRGPSTAARKTNV